MALEPAWVMLVVLLLAVYDTVSGVELFMFWRMICPLVPVKLLTLVMESLFMLTDNPVYPLPMVMCSVPPFC